MTFGQAISSVFSKYGQFTGVAPRSEYWWWVLFVTIVDFALSTLDSTINPTSALGLFSTLWIVVVVLPFLAVAVRRLRDAGLSWKWLWFLLLPIVGVIILIVLLCRPSR